MWGAADVPSQLPVHASKLYSANVVALLTLITADGVVDADLADEVIDGCAVVHQGTVRNAAAAEALGLDIAAGTPAEEPAGPTAAEPGGPVEAAAPDVAQEES